MATRPIVDMFRLSHHEGEKAAVEALRRWLREAGHYPSSILTVAGHFPTNLPRLRKTLEILP